MLPGRGVASLEGRGRAAASFGEEVRGGGEVVRVDVEEPLTAVGEVLRTDAFSGRTPLEAYPEPVSTDICAGAGVASGTGNVKLWF